MSTIKKNSVSRHRNWVFTVNNWTADMLSYLSTIVTQDSSTSRISTSGSITYVIYGKETAPTTGTPHLQGYVEVSAQLSMLQMKLLFGPLQGIHLESRKGSQRQAIDYCKKDNDWTEHGTAKNQGARSDLCSTRLLALESGLRGVSRSVKNYQAIRLAEVFLTYNEEPRDWKPIVHWLWGPTGTGKSHKARLLCSEDVYTKSDGNKWWPGYDRHEGVIIDDFRDSWWSLTEMLRLLDRYECKVEFKGGYRQFVPITIVVTSCAHPKDCYPNTGEAIAQLLRRIDHIENLTDPYVEL